MSKRVKVDNLVYLMSLEPELKCTLLADGSSDKVLMHILEWVIRQHSSDISARIRFGDLRKLPDPPRSLRERIRITLNYYPCDILFVHRDAEGDTIETREREIKEACDNLKGVTFGINVVAVIPIRMTESWLLFDAESIKVAAGNPNYHENLSIPSYQRVERLPNPKANLHNLIKRASNLQGRKLVKLKVPERVHVLAETITDFSPLRHLSAFQKLEADIKTVLTNYRPA